MEELQIETTVYSMSVEPPVEPDRRADERRLALFRVASIVVGQNRGLCLVKNISAGGAVIRPYRALETGAAIEVELKEGQPAGGCVSWTRGSDCGIAFDRPVDVLDLLKTAGDGPRPRCRGSNSNASLSCGRAPWFIAAFCTMSLKAA